MLHALILILYSQMLGEEIEALREIEEIPEIVLEFPDISILEEKKYINLTADYFNKEVDFSIKKLKSIDSFFIMEANPEVRSGIEHYMNGNYDLAIAKLYPSKADPLVNLYVGRSYLKNGEIDEAKRTFDEILDSLSKIDTTRMSRDVKEIIDFSRGEIEMLLGDHDKSIDRFKDFLKKYPWSPLSSNAFGYIILNKLYNIENGKVLLDTLGSEEKKFINNYRNLKKIKNIEFHVFLRSLMSTFYWKIGDYKKAEQWRHKMFAIYPDNRDENMIAVGRWIGFIWYDIGTKTQKIEEPLRFLSSIGSKDYSNLLRSFYLYNKREFKPAMDISLELFLTNFNMEDRWIKEVSANILIATILRSYKKDQTFLYESELIKFAESDVTKGWEDWRSCYMFHLGEYIYRQDPIRAKDVMLNLVDNEVLRYTRGFYMAKISLAWIKMQVYRFDEAKSEFQWVFLHTSYRESIVLAAYGLGLTNLYIGDESNLKEAISYFHVERIPPSDNIPSIYDIIKQKRNINLDDLEIAKRLKPYNLWYLGQTYESLSYFLNAIDVYKYILDRYKDAKQAPQAAQRLVDIYSLAAVNSFNNENYNEANTHLKKAEEYMKVVRKYAEKLGYQNFKGYGIALSSLFRAYLDTKRENKAEKIGREMKEKLQIAEPLENYYYIKALDDTTLTELEQHYNKLREVNPHSKQLPEVMFKLSTMYNKHRDYRKMIPILEELEEWDPYELVRLYLPEVIKALGFAYYKIGQPDKALAKFEKFVKMYPRDKSVPIVMYAIIGIYLDRGDEARTNKLPYEKYRMYYQKALEYIRRMEKEYGENQFYLDHKEDIEQKKKYCKMYL